MYRKIIFAVFVIAISAIYFTFGSNAESRLSDSLDSWAYPQISYLTSEGIIKGYPDSTFRPDNPITIAEFIVIVNRALKFEVTGRVSFSDVNRWDWYYKDIGRAEAAGYMVDSYNGKLEPDKKITREEAAVLISAALELDASSSEKASPVDLLAISSKSRSSVVAVINAGYMTGYPDGTFRPQNFITRAEAAVIIYKCMKSEPPSTLAINVVDFGAKGDGNTDDTAAIQNAIDYGQSMGGGMIWVPKGIYLIDAEVSVKPHSNTTMKLDDNATLKAKPTNNGNYAILRLENVDNMKVMGGNIVGERHEHLGTSGEWGMGISILGSRNIIVTDVSVSDCWGDGIYIDGSELVSYSQNVEVRGFKLNGNRRQGISVISVRGLIIKDGMISDTNGTRPQSGLDLEPDRTENYLQNIIIENLLTINNAGYGIESWFGCGTPNAIQFPAERVSIVIRDHIDKGSSGGTLHNVPYYIRKGYDINVK